MSRKPAKMYRRVTGPAYTKRRYMGGVPGIRVIQFDLGNVRGHFEREVRLVLKERCQVRHTALEAARIAANRYLHKNVGTQNYHMKILVFPHHVLRENKQAVGAGADRVSDGMRRAFGKAVGTAARVSADQAVISIRVNDQYVTAAKNALRKAGMKMPSPFTIEVE
ncbi:MAG TPA: 50S ribosomal protein L16 [Thermoplasmata archaeon]|nr:50S ribosomal protein L16 [Thermoplasmata archaeon]